MAKIFYPKYLSSIKFLYKFTSKYPTMLDSLRLVFFMLITFSINAQTMNFSQEKWSILPDGSSQPSDFVILASGEKIFGNILRDYDLANYDQVVLEKNGSKSVYLPHQLQGFGLANGQLFYSKVLPDNQEPIFLQVLLSGQLELTRYRSRYFIEAGNRFEELKNTYREGVLGRDQVRTVKPYLVTLKSFLSGPCGIELYPKVDRLPFSEQALLSLVEEYLACTKDPYQTHLRNVPIFKISPLVGGGIAHFSLNPVENISERGDRLTQPLGYFGFFGIRFHDFRLLPRFSTDFRLNLITYETEINSSYAGSQVVWTGSERLRESAIYIPWSFHYSVLKKERMDFYIGFSAGLWYGSISTQDGMIDERNLTLGEILISEHSITTGLEPKFISGFKFGSNFKLKGKSRIFAELEYGTQSSFYRFSLDVNESDYSRDRLSIQVGLEF